MGLIGGLLFGGPLLAAVGLVIGHIHDVSVSDGRRREANAPIDNDYFPDFVMNDQQRAVFTLSVIVLGAKLAKADGHVTREEVLAFRRAFRTRDAQLPEVGKLFDKARTSAEGYEPYAARLASAFRGSRSVLEEILFGLFVIALADSHRLSTPELLFLRRVAVIFGFNEGDFERLASRVGLSLRGSSASSSVPPSAPSSPPGAYHVLGLSVDASDKDIKRTYRALIQKYHPDKLMAQGKAPELIAQATENMKKINAAYNELCRLRGLR